MNLLFKQLIAIYCLFIVTNVLFAPNQNSFTDVDGNTYSIIKIGQQEWLAENFRASHSPNGSSVPGIYVYEDDQNNVDKYGRLYTIEAAEKVCPTGWHIPSDQEWMELEMELGMAKSETTGSGMRGTDEGKKLKVGGSAGFNGVLCGYWSFHSGFGYEGGMTIYWSIDENVDDIHRMLRILANNSDQIDRSGAQKFNAFSLRLLKDKQLKGIL